MDPPLKVCPHLAPGTGGCDLIRKRVFADMCNKVEDLGK